jgi:hypothetical protein
MDVVEAHGESAEAVRSGELFGFDESMNINRIGILMENSRLRSASCVASPISQASTPLLAP